jgi:hypothetical protein
MSRWIQLYVVHDGGPERTKEGVDLAEPMLIKFGAVPKRPVDKIVLEEDGTAQIRVYEASVFRLLGVCLHRTI